MGWSGDLGCGVFGYLFQNQRRKHKMKVLRAKVTAKRSVCTSSKIQVQTDRNQQQHSFIVFCIFCIFYIFYKFYFPASKSHGKAAGRTTECTSRPRGPAAAQMPASAIPNNPSKKNLEKIRKVLRARVTAKRPAAQLNVLADRKCLGYNNHR